jgi:hypothetical protein
MTNNETTRAMELIEDTIAGLETNIDQLTRRLEQLQDIQRAAQYLVDAIHVSKLLTVDNAEGIFGDAYANIRLALKAYYQPNGSAR